MSSAPAISMRLVGDEADDDALDAREADDDVAAQSRHAPRAVRRGRPGERSRRARPSARRDRPGSARSAPVVAAQRRSSAVRLVRRILGVVGGQVGKQLLHDLDGVAIVVGDEVHVAADRRVHVGAADVVHRGRLARSPP